jgi:hypothetical protein
METSFAQLDINDPVNTLEDAMKVIEVQKNELNAKDNQVKTLIKALKEVIGQNDTVRNSNCLSSLLLIYSLNKE